MCVAANNISILIIEITYFMNYEQVTQCDQFCKINLFMMCSVFQIKCLQIQKTDCVATLNAFMNDAQFKR